MAKAERQAAVEEITEQFRGSSAALLTEYRGLTVKQLKQLRRSLGADTQYAVVKNTLTKRAATAAGIPVWTRCWPDPPRSPSSRATRWRRPRGCATSRRRTRCW